MHTMGNASIHSKENSPVQWSDSNNHWLVVVEENSNSAHLLCVQCSLQCLLSPSTLRATYLLLLSRLRYLEFQVLVIAFAFIFDYIHGLRERSTEVSNDTFILVTLPRPKRNCHLARISEPLPRKDNDTGSTPVILVRSHQATAFR
jgi:hypothetical protein